MNLNRSMVLNSTCTLLTELTLQSAWHHLNAHAITPQVEYVEVSIEGKGQTNSSMTIKYFVPFCLGS